MNTIYILISIDLLGDSILGIVVINLVFIEKSDSKEETQ